MKNKKMRTIIGITAGALALILVAGGITTYANAATKVSSVSVERSDINSKLQVNGKVVSGETENFYSISDLKVKEVKVKVGDRVKKGDVLLTFDEAEIDKILASLDYQEEMAEGGYRNQIDTAKKYQALYSEAETNLGVLNNQIKETEEKIAAKQKEIVARQSALAREGANIQIAAIDEAGTEDYEKRLKQAQNNAYYQQYDAELVRLNEELNALTVQLADFKEYKAEMTSQKATANQGRITEGAKSELEASLALGKDQREDLRNKLIAAKEGIKAECDGVVTGVFAADGSLAATGMNLVSVQSTEKIEIRCDVNKYDIMSIEVGQSVNVTILGKDYEGTVTGIEGIMGIEVGTGNGIGVIVELSNPDDNIILGLDVKPEINVAFLEDVISVPREAVYTEDGENYVFVEKDKKASKVSVETGVGNDSVVEISEGLKEGDVVVWDDAEELKNGTAVRHN